MKKGLLLLITLVTLTAWSQTSSVQAPPTGGAPAPQSGSSNPEAIDVKPEETAAAPQAAPAVATSAKKTTGKSVAKAPAKKPNPWSGLAVLEVARATDVNHSKILDEENPDKRTQSSLAFKLRAKFKINDKSSISATQTFEKDIVTNPVDETENEVRVKNISVNYTRATDMTVFGSAPIAMPYIFTLPTSYDSRKAGVIGGFAMAPSLGWEINPTWSVSLDLYAAFTFKSPVDQEYAWETVMENSTLLLSNSVTLAAAVTDAFSISQTVGITSQNKNFRTLTGSDQIGAELDVSTGIGYTFSPSFSMSASVNQAAPIQGAGFGTKVYESNLFRLYHVAQTSYGLSGALSF